MAKGRNSVDGIDSTGRSTGTRPGEVSGIGIIDVDDEGNVLNPIDTIIRNTVGEGETVSENYRNRTIDDKLQEQQDIARQENRRRAEERGRARRERNRRNRVAQRING